MQGNVPTRRSRKLLNEKLGDHPTLRPLWTFANFCQTAFVLCSILEAQPLRLSRRNAATHSDRLMLYIKNECALFHLSQSLQLLDPQSPIWSPSISVCPTPYFAASILIFIMFPINSIMSPPQYNWDHASSFQDNFNPENVEFANNTLRPQPSTGATAAVQSSSDANLKGSGRQPRRRDLDWEQHKEQLRSLYLETNKKLDDILQIMQQEHNFTAT